MDCILSAGGVPQHEDLLYTYTQGRPKALIPLAGKPMVQWVVDALEAAQTVERIVVVGLQPEDGIHGAKIAAYLPDHGALIANLIAGVDEILRANPHAPQALVCSADIPTITGEMVDWLVGACDDPDLHLTYSIVSRALMEARFPNSRRSYTHLVEGDFAAADIHVVDPRIAYTHRDLWNDLLNRRKSALKQAARIGFDLLFKLLIRRLSLPEAEARIAQRLGLRGRALIVNYAELGMDVDKPIQLKICAEDLAARKA